MTTVSDSSPLISLAAIGRLELFQKALKLIPAVEPCLRELLAAGKYVDPAIYRDILLKAEEL